MGKRISAITGGKGFVGYALVKELNARGENMRLLLRSDSEIFDGINCEKVFGDLANIDDLVKAFEGAEVVYHIAGLVDISETKSELLWKVNVEGTKNVIEACKRCSVKKLVYVSSVDAVPVPDGEDVIKEVDSFNPDLVSGDYGKSKAAASQLVLDSADDNLQVFIVHPSACIGPDDFNETSNVLSMIKLYLRGIFRVTMDFGATNFIDVRDLANGMIIAAEKGRSGQCYFLSGYRYTLDEFMNTLSAVCGKKPPKVVIKRELVYKMAPSLERVFEIADIPPILNDYSLRKLEENCNFSNEKAKSELGFNPRPFEETLADTVKWLKDRE